MKRKQLLILAVCVLAFGVIGAVALFRSRAAVPIQIDTSLPQVRNLRAQPDDRVITVRWDAPNNASGAGIVGYFIEYGETALGTFPYTKQTTYPAVQIQPIDNNKEYSIRVYAAHGSTVQVPTPGAHGSSTASERRGSGRVSSPVSITATANSSRVDALRQEMTGFFDDFNTPAGPFDELKWNQAGSACVQAGSAGAFVNNQHHSHNQLSTIRLSGGTEFCDRGQFASRARGVFDIAGRTEANPGVIVFDMDGATNIEKRGVWYLDLIPMSARNSGAPVDVTAHASAFDDEPSDPSMIRLAQGDVVGGVKLIYYDNNKNPRDVPLTYSCQSCRNMNRFIPNVRVPWRVEISNTKIKVFIEGERALEGNMPADFSGVTKYQVHSTIFGYNIGKDNPNNAMTFLFHWDNFGFNGPASPTVVHNYVEGGATGSTPYLGLGTIQHKLPKGPRTTVVPIPDQIGNPVKARIMFTLTAVGPGWYDYNSSHSVRINGNNYPLPHPRTMVPAPVWSAWNGNTFYNGNNPMSLYIDINPAHLVRGNNQVQFNIEGHHQAMTNVHVELEYNRGSQPSYTQPKNIFGEAVFGSFVTPAMSDHDKYLFIEQNLGLSSASDHGHPPVNDPPVPADTTPPTVAITAPSSGQTVSGTVNVAASASDTQSNITQVRFYLNGSNTPFSTDSSSPFAASWNTAGVANGTYSITARATDSAGNEGASTPVSVTVHNVVPDTTPPTTAISFPAGGARLSGPITVVATASDNVGIDRVELLINGQVRATDRSHPYSFAWNTASYSDGTHTLQTRAYDTAGNSASSASVSVVVDNVPDAPPSGPRPGDVNGDGKVDIFDLAQMLSNWGRSNATRAQGDLNNDGVVNIFDLSQLVSNWGK